MSKNHTRVEQAILSKSTTITNDQLSLLSIQFESITRYFKTSLFGDGIN